MKKDRIISGAAFLAPFALLALLASPASAATLTQQMQVGDTGTQVSALQTFLASNSAWYPEGLVTGYFGNLTKQAVLRFQTAEGIDAVGRVGPITLAKINSLMGAGSSSTGPLQIYAGPDAAPIISAATVATTSNSATISWATNTPAQNRVMYGTSWPFLYASAPSVSVSGLQTSPSVQITGLQPNTTYYYVQESVGANGSLQWTVAHSFKTNP